MEKIDKYLHNRMSSEERRAFEEQAKKNPELAAELAFAQKAYAHLQKQKQRQALKKMLKETAATRHKTKVIAFPGRRWLSAAASIALLIALFFVFKDRFLPNQQLPSYADLEQHTPLALTQMGGEDIYATQAEAAFNKGDYRAAAAALQAYLQEKPDDRLAQLYLAISLIEAGQQEEARKWLEPLLQSVDFKEKAIGYMALSYHKEGKSEQAEAWLKKLQ